MCCQRGVVKYFSMTWNVISGCVIVLCVYIGKNLVWIIRLLLIHLFNLFFHLNVRYILYICVLIVLWSYLLVPDWVVWNVMKVASWYLTLWDFSYTYILFLHVFLVQVKTLYIIINWVSFPPFVGDEPYSI